MSKSKTISISISEDLLKLYPHAKESILFFETNERVMSIEAITEFRDCMDHLMLAFTFSGDPDRFKDETNSALEHLRRASIEPLEYAVENKIADISKSYKWANWYRILLIPFSRNIHYSSLLEGIKKEIIAGRDCKNLEKWQEGVNHFKHAYELSMQLENLTPGKEILLGRIFAILLLVIAFILGKIF